MTADEVRMLPNEKSILLIRGEKPVIDLKYDIMKHPNIQYTTDGKEKNYEHGIVDRATAEFTLLRTEEVKNINITLEIPEMKEKNRKNDKELKEDVELLSDEEIEDYIKMEEFENERKFKN